MDGVVAEFIKSMLQFGLLKKVPDQLSSGEFCPLAVQNLQQKPPLLFAEHSHCGTKAEMSV